MKGRYYLHFVVGGMAGLSLAYAIGEIWEAQIKSIDNTLFGLILIGAWLVVFGVIYVLKVVLRRPIIYDNRDNKNE